MQLCCITKVVQLLQTKKIFVSINIFAVSSGNLFKYNSSSDFPVI